MGDRGHDGGFTDDVANQNRDRVEEIIREYLKGRGASGISLYAPTMYLVAVLLVIGLICNLSVRAVDERHYFRGKRPTAR